MKVYRVIRTYADGTDGPVQGYAKQYANGQWVFAPALSTGRKQTKKRHKSFDTVIPKWAGGLDGTRSEHYDWPARNANQ